MFRHIYSFQLKYTLHRPLLYVFFALLAFIAFDFASNVDPGHTKMFPLSGAWHNAPYVIGRYLAEMSIFGFILTVVLVAPAVFKDFKHQSQDFFFSSTITKLDYLAGRFLGALSANIFAFGGIIAGLVIGCLAIDASFTGPFRIWAFLQPFIVFVIPNTLLLAAVMFGFASISRSLVATYVTAIICFFLYTFTAFSSDSFTYPQLAMMLDPFGNIALRTATEFWTVTDKNTSVIPFEGFLLYNRLCWLFVSGSIFAFTCWKFDFESVREIKEIRKTSLLQTHDVPTSPAHFTGELQKTSKTSKSLRYVKQWWTLSFDGFKKIAIHPAFLVLTFMAVVETFRNFTQSVGVFGNSVYPHTSFFLPIASDHIQDFVWGITLFFAGVIVWRERDHESQEMFGASSVPDGVLYGSKLFSLMMLQALYVVIAMLCGILAQASMGFTRFEIDVYLAGLGGVDLINYWHLALAAILLQILSPNKYVGFVLTGLYLIGMQYLASFFPDRLLLPGTVPFYIYSDMNGFGHFAKPIVWYRIYGIFFAGLLIITSSLLFVRALSEGLADQFREATSKWRGLHMRAALLLLIGFLGTGGFIFYNTHILNPYQPADFFTNLAVKYEQRYKSLENRPQASPVHANITAELFPKDREALIKGTFRLKNKTATDLSVLDVFLAPTRGTVVNVLEPAKQHTLTTKDHEVGYYRFELDQALLPGDSVNFDFDISLLTPGFTDNRPNNDLAHNGTYLDNFRRGIHFPMLGYTTAWELQSDHDRALHQLPALVQATLEDERVAWRHENNRISLRATVTTDSDQIAIAPGDLANETEANGRRTFVYETQTPIIDRGLALLSGSYEVLKDQHAGRDIEIYYHPDHGYNLDRMVHGIKASLDYSESRYGPYPHAAVKIVEVPKYGNIRGTARSLPGIFTWTETGGFLSQIHEGAIDNVFNTTTHEMAHQWWGHQVDPALVEGAGIFIESMAQWVRVRVMEETYGQKKTQQFREEELRRYLRGRSFSDEEKSMRRARDTHLLYNKGTLVMYALADYIGADSVDVALRQIVQQFGNTEGPYPTTPDLVRAFRAVTPDSLQQVVTDLFERITFFELLIEAGEVTENPAGGFKISTTIEAKKMYADAKGEESDAGINDYIDIGVFDEDENLIYLKKHKFDQQKINIRISVLDKPSSIIIDPYAILIEKDKEDNRYEF